MSSYKKTEKAAPNRGRLACELTNERLRLSRVHAHLLARLVFALVLHHAVDPGEERIVAPLAHVRARVELGPALPNENRTRMHLLAVKPFDPEILGLAVSSVSRASDSFFMSNLKTSG